MLCTHMPFGCTVELFVCVRDERGRPDRPETTRHRTNPLPRSLPSTAAPPHALYKRLRTVGRSVGRFVRLVVMADCVVWQIGCKRGKRVTGLSPSAVARPGQEGEGGYIYVCWMATRATRPTALAGYLCEWHRANWLPCQRAELVARTRALAGTMARFINYDDGAAAAATGLPWCGRVLGNGHVCVYD